jgi:hypothetical protein
MVTAWRWPLVIGLVLLGSGAGVSRAQSAEETRCTGSFIIILDPGLSTEPSTGRHYSESPGKIECHGPVNGHDPSGPGTLTQEGRYGIDDPDSCQAGGEADGTDHLTVPTADGSQRIDSPFRAVFGKTSNENGPFGGEFKGSRFTGSFTIQPLDGDCVSRPVTRARVNFEGTLHD